MSSVTIHLRTLSGELLQMSVEPDDSVKTVVHRLLMSESQWCKCANFVRIVREKENNENENNEKKWSENETALVFYDFQPKSYSIHDNGGVPFIVEVGNETISIYDAVEEYDETEDGYEYRPPVKGELLHETSYQKVWIGDNELNDCNYDEKNIYPGNSILVHLSDEKYLYIGREIYRFSVEEGDQIKMYFSPVGNNDVPYPYAIGEKMAYFMLEQNFVPVETIDVNQDGYDQFYEQHFSVSGKQGELLPIFKDVVTIQERV